MNLEEYLNQSYVPTEIVDLANEVMIIENQLLSYKTLQDKAKELKEQLKQSMQKNGISKWVTINGTQITLIPDKEDIEEEVSYIDEEKFISENAELHNQYVDARMKYKKTKVELVKGKKGYVKITPRKEKKNATN